MNEKEGRYIRQGQPTLAGENRRQRKFVPIQNMASLVLTPLTAGGVRSKALPTRHPATTVSGKKDCYECPELLSGPLCGSLRGFQWVSATADTQRGKGKVLLGVRHYWNDT